MIELRFRIGKRNYTSAQRAYQSLAIQLEKNWEGSFEVVKGQLLEHLKDVASAVAEANSTPWPAGTTAKSVSRRTGAGVAAIRNSVFIEGTQWNTLKGGFRLDGHMAVHEVGATINAKGKLLTIPLPAALGPNGVPLKKSARDWDRTFVARSKRGNLLIFQKRGREIVPLYVLKEHVTIPARLGMRDAFKADLQHFISKAVDTIAARMTLDI